MGVFSGTHSFLHPAKLQKKEDACAGILLEYYTDIVAYRPDRQIPIVIGVIGGPALSLNTGVML